MGPILRVCEREDLRGAYRFSLHCALHCCSRAAQSDCDAPGEERATQSEYCREHTEVQTPMPAPQPRLVAASASAKSQTRAARARLNARALSRGSARRRP